MAKNLQILILVGAPGSGKTTFARYFLRTEENWMRLCRDDFRTMQFASGNLSHHEERFYQPTVRFLEKYVVSYHHLWMRKNKDFRKDLCLPCFQVNYGNF